MGSKVMAASEKASLELYLEYQDPRTFVPIRSGSSQTHATLSGCLGDKGSSLIDIHGDWFFTYHQTQNFIGIGKSRTLFQSSNAEGQLLVNEKLQLSLKIPFLVRTLSLRPGLGESCVLWGPGGIVFIDFCSEDKFTLTREGFVDENTYIDHRELKIVRCIWIPSFTHKVIAVLNSDFFIRVYNLETNQPLKSICVGPENSIPFCFKYYAETHPDSPIDFNVSLHFPRRKAWAIFVMKASGEIFGTLMTLVGGTTLRCVLESSGPIKSMEENAVDGHSSVIADDAYSSLLCTKQYPFVLIVGMNSGQIIHYILLPEDELLENEEMDEDCIINTLQNNKFTMQVKERIHLGSNKSLSPMELYQDPLFDERYLCVYNGAARLVTMKFVPEIRAFIDSEIENSLASLSPSVCRLLVLWNLSKRSQTTNHLLGVAFSDTQAQKIIFVLKDKRTITFTLPHPTNISHITALDGRDGNATDSSNIFGNEDVLKIAQNMLRNSGSQPFYCSSQELDGKELLNLLGASLDIKNEQIVRMHTAADYLMKYLSKLQAKSNEMNTTVTTLLENRTQLKIQAENLAEKYEECAEHDELLTKRLENVLHRYHINFPVVTDKEKEMIHVVKDMEEKVDDFKHSMHQLTKQVNQIKLNAKAISTFHLNLAPSQIKFIKEEIANQQNYLASIVSSLRQVQGSMPI